MVIFSIPYAGICKIPGAELGPAYILKELVFTNRETYRIVHFKEFNNSKKIDILRKSMMDMYNKNEIVLILGGNHATTSFVINEVLSELPSLGCIIFDAHNDNDKSEIEEVCNWNVINKIHKKVEKGVIIGYRHESDFMPASDKFCYIKDTCCQLEQKSITCIREICKDTDCVYLSIDVDVLNPCEFLGTGYKIAGGLFLRELLFYIDLIKQSAKKLFIDIVEFNPLIEKEQSLLVIKRIIEEIKKTS